MKNKFQLLFLLLVFITIYIINFDNKENIDHLSLPSVTVVNQIRGPELGLENSDLLESLRDQWRATKDADITATWLWQYSALENKDLTNFATAEMTDQEFGIFLEIDRNFAEKTGVRYRGKGPWYFSDGLYLVSYERDDRRKFIDKVFGEFKAEFGFYPKTVGAWWVGAESINYMKSKYDIAAVLQVADQFNTDKYSIWGTPWSIPYIPSTRNAAIPANSFSGKIPDVIILQWAPRDPVDGYGNSVYESTYSLQDYTMKKYNTNEYLTYFRDIFLKKQLDHLVIGLEGGFGKGTYSTTYKSNLLEFKKWEDDGLVKIQTADNYASEFLNRNKILPPTNYFLAEGFENKDQSFWYMSPNYRVLIQKQGDNIYLSDFRDYHKTAQEEFYELPNTQGLLRINTKSVIDSVRFPNEKLKLLSSGEPIKLTQKDSVVLLKSDNKLIAEFKRGSVSLPTVNKKWEFNPLINSIAEPNYEVVAILIILVYIVFLYGKRRDKLLTPESIFGLIFGLFIFYPFYSSGQFFTESIKFTPISLSIFKFMNFGFLDPNLKLFINFQFIPLAFLMLIHYLLLIKNKKANLAIVFCVAIYMAIFLYLDNFYPRLIMFANQGKRSMLITALSVTGVMGTAIASYYLYRRDLYKPLFIYIALSGFLFIWFNQNKIFAHKNYIITHFEWEALNKVYDLRENVLYPAPEFKAENYQNTFPLIAVDKLYAEKLTSVSWSSSLYEDQPIEYAGKDNIMVVSRYIGVEFTEDSSVIKLLDNGQIAIYEIKR